MLKKRTLTMLVALLLVCLAWFGNPNNVKGSTSGIEIVKHRVVNGQTLWSIANKYGVSITELIKWNKIANPNLLHVGQSLEIHIPKVPANTALNSKDLELLARVIYAEARGENFEGQVAVGAVVLNRLRDSGFPKTIKGVIYQPGAFTAIEDQQIRLNPDKNAWTAAEKASQGIDPTNGALFYYNPSLAKDRWIRSRPVLKVIGNHVFSS